MADLRAVMFDAASSAWLAAGSDGALLRSIDGGISWKSVDSPYHGEIQALAREPVSGALLLGGTEGVIGRSTDGGASWRIAPVEMPQPLTPVTGFHSCGARLFARSALGRVLVSSDHGASWRVAETSSRAFFTDGYCDMRRGAIVLSSHLGEVFRSVDGGEHWQTVSFQGEDNRKFLSALRADPGSGALILGAHHGAAFRSTDGGASWMPAVTTHTASMESLLVAGRRVVGFGAGGFLVSSTDAGRTWRVSNPPLDVVMREVVALPDSRVLVASGELGGVLRSSDGGANWREIAVAYPNMNTPPNLRALVAHDATLLAAGPPGTILRSESGGASWQLVHWTPLEAQEAFPWLLFDEHRDRVVAIEAHGSFYLSQDAGRSWKPGRVDATREFWQGALRSRDGFMLAAGSRVWRPPAPMAPAGRCATRVVTLICTAALSTSAVSSCCCWVTRAPSCEARTTARAGSAPRVDTSHALRRALREPRTGALLAFGEHGTILRSTDEGMSFQSVASGTDAELRAALLEPRTQNVIIVGQRGVILRSVDGGRSFARLDSHTLRSFRSAAFDARSGALLVVGERLVRLQPLPVSNSQRVLMICCSRSSSTVNSVDSKFASA